MALHFNKQDLCCFCRLILIFHNQYEQNTSKPRTRISPRHPHVSNAQLLLIIEYGIISSTPKQRYTIIFTTLLAISISIPYPYPLAIHSKLHISMQSIQKSHLTSSPQWSFPGPPVTHHCPTSHTLYVAASYLMSYITFTQCGSLTSHELHPVNFLTFLQCGIIDTTNPIH